MFSFGVVLREMLDATDPALDESDADEEFVAVRPAERTGIHDALSAPSERCTAPEPTRRPSDFAEVAARIHVAACTWTPSR